MNQYEVAVLYDPGLEIDLDKAENKVKKIFQEAEATVKSTDNWGKRKLAYKIKGQEHGIYVFYMIELAPANVAKVENDFNIVDEILRFLFVKIDPRVEAKVKAAKAELEKEEKEAKVQSEEE